MPDEGRGTPRSRTDGGQRLGRDGRSRGGKREAAETPSGRVDMRRWCLAACHRSQVKGSAVCNTIHDLIQSSTVEAPVAAPRLPANFLHSSPYISVPSLRNNLTRSLAYSQFHLIRSPVCTLHAYPLTLRSEYGRKPWACSSSLLAQGFPLYSLLTTDAHHCTYRIKFSRSAAALPAQNVV